MNASKEHTESPPTKGTDAPVTPGSKIAEDLTGVAEDLTGVKTLLDKINHSRGERSPADQSSLDQALTKITTLQGKVKDLVAAAKALKETPVATPTEARSGPIPLGSAQKPGPIETKKY